MAEAATTAGGKPQAVEQFQQWNKQDWWDPTRWSLTGGIADSDFKCGLWWQDSIDMNKNVPALEQAAQEWTKVQQQFQAMREGIRNARNNLVGFKGENATAQGEALDKLDASLVHQMDQMTPVPNALRNLAGIVQTGHQQMQVLWDKWDGDRAAAPVCHEDVVQMQPIIGGMAQAHLDTADVIQKAWSTELEAPGPGASSINGAPATGATGQEGAGTTIRNGTAGSADGTAGSAEADGTNDSSEADGTNDASGSDSSSPKVLAASSGTHAGVTNFGATPGTVVAPSAGSGSSSNNDNGVTLAGAGAGTLAPPPSLTGGSISTGLGTAGAPAALGGGLGGAGGGGVFGAPFVPGGMGAAGAGGFGGGLGGATREAGRRSSGGDPTTRNNPFIAGEGEGSTTSGRLGGLQGRAGGAGAGMTPMIGGGAPTTGRAGGARPTVRPGYADRGRNAGVAAGLLGRAAKDADFNAIGAGSNARRTTRRRGAEQDDEQTVRFLDEEAWLTDDPGAGVIKSEGSDARNRPQLG